MRQYFLKLETYSSNIEAKVEKTTSSPQYLKPEGLQWLQESIKMKVQKKKWEVESFVCQDGQLVAGNFIYINNMC